MSRYWSRPDTGDFTPCPEGLHDAVLADVAELQVRDYNDPTKMNNKVRLVFQIDQVNEDHPEKAKFTCGTPPLTPSLHERAKLRKLLEGWRGKKMSEKELEKFDSETLIGINGQILVKHQIRDNGDTYANVTEILPPKKDKKGKQDWKRLEVEGYTRVRDRTPKDDERRGNASRQRTRSPMDEDYAGQEDAGDPWSGGGKDEDRDEAPF